MKDAYGMLQQKLEDTEASMKRKVKEMENIISEQKGQTQKVIEEKDLL